MDWYEIKSNVLIKTLLSPFPESPSKVKLGVICETLGESRAFIHALQDFIVDHELPISVEEFERKPKIVGQMFLLLFLHGHRRKSSHREKLLKKFIDHAISNPKRPYFIVKSGQDTPENHQFHLEVGHNLGILPANVIVFTYGNLALSPTQFQALLTQLWE